MTDTASKVSDIKAEVRLLSDLIYKGRIATPWHQRAYDWEKKHVVALLKDIQETVSTGTQRYFLGTVMLVQQSEGRWEVNDGQQRIITYSLICERLRRTFADKDTQRAGLALRITHNLKHNHTERLQDMEEDSARLVLSKQDKLAYRLLISGKKVGTNGKLVNAWKAINTYFDEVSLEQQNKFFDQVIQGIEVTCLDIPNSRDLNAIYEALNGRGKQLSEFDLIRNYFYSFFKSPGDGSRKKKIHNELEKIRTYFNTNTLIDGYARCYLQNELGYLKDKELFRETKKKLREEGIVVGEEKSRTSICKLIEDFGAPTTINYYLIIRHPENHAKEIKKFLKDSKTTSSNHNLKSFLDDLKTYTVAHPILFAWLHRYLQESSEKNRKKLACAAHHSIRILTSFVMRVAFTTSALKPSKFDDRFADTAKKISNMSFEDLCTFKIVDELKKCDKDGIISDKQFTIKMENRSMGTGKKTKRLLLGLLRETQIDADMFNPGECTVEHILPQSSDYLRGWTKFDELEHTKHVDTIGNLTLLGKSDNSPKESYNNSFDAKKKVFEGSYFRITKEICNYKEWSLDSIIKRQTKLIELVTKIWGFE